MPSIFVLCLLFSQASWSQKLQEEKELEVVDLTNVTDVLKKDGLKKEVEKKQELLKKIEIERQKNEQDKYNYPNEDDFYSFANEYWLVKNASWLKWDIIRPDYGLDLSLNELFRQLSLVGFRYQILLTDSPELTHLALEGNGRILFLLSYPFVKSMDLSKIEISLLFLESYLRHKENYLKINLDLKDIQVKLGQNFSKDKVDIKWVYEYQKKLSSFLKEDGFSFQQQFELTKKIDILLRTRPELWNSYLKLLQKIDRQVKADMLYKSYPRIYPSPELQIKWMTPKNDKPI